VATQEEEKPLDDVLEPETSNEEQKELEVAQEEEKALDDVLEPETSNEEQKELEVTQENPPPEDATPSDPTPVPEELPSDNAPQVEADSLREEIMSEPMQESEEIVEDAIPSGEDTPQPGEEAAPAPIPESQDTPETELKEENAPMIESEEPVEATSTSDDLPIAKIAAGVAAAAIAATVLDSKDESPEPEVQISNEATVDEPEGLEEVAEEPASGEREPPSPGSNKYRRHRSSRHSKSSSRTISSREGPSEEGRPQLHRRRRESENSLKNMFFAPPSPRKLSRHDSGISAGSTSPSSRKYRSERTPEEQAAHEERKAARQDAKLKAAEYEGAVLDEPTASSSRRHSSSRSTHTRDDGEKKPKLLDMKGESVIKAKLIAIDKPHIKETVEKSTKVPIIDRPRFSMDGERPRYLERSNTSRNYNSHRSSSDRKAREERDRHKAEEERELRKAREETRRQMERARKEVAEESRRQQERDDEDRRIRREARRQRMEEEERANEDTPESSAAGPKGRLVKEKSRNPPRRSEREREKERERSKSKGPLKSLWSTAKKAFS